MAARTQQTAVPDAPILVAELSQKDVRVINELCLPAVRDFNFRGRLLNNEKMVPSGVWRITEMDGNQAEGRLFIHLGDDSGFKAVHQ